MKCPVCVSPAQSDNITLGGFAIFRCVHCGLRFAPDAFRVNTNYDSVYELDSYIETQIRPIREERNKLVFTEIGTYQCFFKNVRLAPGHTLLDVGCGVGRFLHGAHLKGWQVEGIDISAKAIAIGQKFAPFSMSVNTLENIAESGRRFDVVTLFEVLEHLSDPCVILRKAQKVLKPSGAVFCTVPNWDCSVVQHAVEPAWVPPVHLMFYKEESLSALAGQAGLSVIAKGFIHADPFPVKIHPKWPGRVVKWAGRRLFGRPNEALGIWMYAKANGRNSAEG